MEQEQFDFLEDIEIDKPDVGRLPSNSDGIAVRSDDVTSKFVEL